MLKKNVEKVVTSARKHKELIVSVIGIAGVTFGALSIASDKLDEYRRKVQDRARDRMFCTMNSMQSDGYAKFMNPDVDERITLTPELAYKEWRKKHCWYDD